ncbi:MAG: DNA glycosylase [Verrucomicrobiota bacterium]
MPKRINVSDFDLAASLMCGQAFRWSAGTDGWFTGVVGQRVCRLRQTGKLLEGDIDPHYLGLDVSLLDIVATFPDDDVLQQAVRQHWGVRVLRQEPWETLASFIASSTKQIVQIRQIVENLARRFGQPLGNDAFSFPDAATIAGATLPQLRACKLGFRAEYLLAAARMVDRDELRLNKLPALEYERALEELTKIHGVGEKIANCTLLFSLGFDQAFPVDVWMQRALHRLGWRGKKITRRQVLDHFGPYAGWAQQYLFFSERSR